MHESSPRSWEVANALFQIDRLTQDQTRAILRHIAIDDAVLNEAQCSHVACVINGTLNKVPREGVNATLTCGTSLDAASHWEKSFASHPGHVSATFRKNSINNGTEADQSKKQVVLFKTQETAAAASNNASNDPKISVKGPPELSGLSIINQGQLTLHYHSYHAAPSPAYRPTVESRKHALEKDEDEEYSEALASLMDCDLSAPNRSAGPGTSKRQRLEEPEPEMVEAEAEMTEAEAETPESEVKIAEAGEQRSQVTQDDGHNQPMKQKKKYSRLCKKCGSTFNLKRNNGPKKRCRSHPGTLEAHPDGLKRTDSNGAPLKPLYAAWSCCYKGRNEEGCVCEKHEEDTG